VFTTYDVPGAGTVNGAATRAYGINAAGQIVGDFDSTTGTHGYVYDGATFTILDFPGADFTQAFGINDAGDIVGATSFAGVGGYSGFAYTNGQFVKLDNPAASSPGGSLVTIAQGINSRGQIVGLFTDVGAYRAFVFDKGVFTTIDLPPGADNENFALGVNNAGRIVGYYNSATGNHGFLASPVHGRNP
jgi:probable HAF family extracellular repeat protein